MLSVCSDLPLVSAGLSHQENSTHTHTHPLTISTIYSKTHTEVKSAAYATTAVHSFAKAHQHNCTYVEQDLLKSLASHVHSIVFLASAIISAPSKHHNGCSIQVGIHTWRSSLSSLIPAQKTWSERGPERNKQSQKRQQTRTSRRCVHAGSPPALEQSLFWDLSHPAVMHSNTPPSSLALHTHTHTRPLGC